MIPFRAACVDRVPPYRTKPYLPCWRGCKTAHCSMLCDDSQWYPSNGYPPNAIDCLPPNGYHRHWTFEHWRGSQTCSLSDDYKRNLHSAIGILVGSPSDCSSCVFVCFLCDHQFFWYFLLLFTSGFTFFGSLLLLVNSCKLMRVLLFMPVPFDRLCCWRRSFDSLPSFKFFWRFRKVSKSSFQIKFRLAILWIRFFFVLKNRYSLTICLILTNQTVLCAKS